MPYYSRQEKAAYILSVVKNQIDNFDSESKRQISSMYNAISNFEIITNFSFDDTPNQSYGFRLAKVAKNIVLLKIFLQIVEMRLPKTGSSVHLLFMILTIVFP